MSKNRNNQQMPTFECVLIGDRSSGKTTFVKRHLTGEFEKKLISLLWYVATLGVEVHPLVFNTSRGTIKFNVWDSAAQGRGSAFKLEEDYYKTADCAMIFFDLTCRSSYTFVPLWNMYIRARDIPVVLCGNKVDIKDCEVIDVSSEKEKSLQYVEMSTKNCENFEKPFLYLARKLMCDPNLEFSEMKALLPPDIQIDFALQEQIKKDLQYNTDNVNLPDEDENI